MAELKDFTAIPHNYHLIHRSSFGTRHEVMVYENETCHRLFVPYYARNVKGRVWYLYNKTIAGVTYIRVMDSYGAAGRFLLRNMKAR